MILMARRWRFWETTTSSCMCRGGRGRCRFTIAMPTATNCCSCIAARGRSRPTSVRCDSRPGDYIVIPRAVTYRLAPDTTDNFFLIMQSQGEFEQPEKGLIGQTSLYDPGVIVTPEPKPGSFGGKNGEWEVRIKCEDEYSKIFYPFNPLDVVGWKGDLTVWKINLRDIRPVMSHRVHLPPSAHSTFVTPGAVVCSFVPRPLEQDAGGAAGAVLPSQYRLRRVHFLSRRRLFQPRQHQSGHVHAASARDSSRAASESAGESDEEDADRRVRGDARRAESDPLCCRRASRWSGKNTGRHGLPRRRRSDRRSCGDAAAGHV